MFEAETLAVLMFTALALCIFSGLPVAFVMAGIAWIFGTIAVLMDHLSWINLFAIVPRIFGSAAETMVLSAVPLFIFMGCMMEKSGIARDLLTACQYLLRKVPGGLSLAVVMMGTVLAATTGIVGASVVMMSVLCLPVMLKNRYDPSFATGTVAASGTLGILIPPSIMLLVLAEMLSISAGVLFMSAMLPGLLLAMLYMMYVMAVAKIKPELAPKPDENPTNESLMSALGKLVPTVMLVALVLGSILAGWVTPTEASAVGAFGALLLGYYAVVINKRRPELEKGASTKSRNEEFMSALSLAVKTTALTNAMLFAIIICATAFSYVFRLLGGDDVVINLIQSSGLSAWQVLGIIMLMTFVLGFFLEWIEISLILLPVFGPIVAGLDFGEHIDSYDILYWFAILMAVNLQSSFLTPPFGTALFYLKASAPKSITLLQIYKGIVPFVLLQLTGLALIALFPALATWLPEVLK
ncbi:TRAP transporter large permease subunit [Vibrio sp. S9_S30]|uniref:TRAP transporter large permease n=1 Tax=Vibrio sp. S9_S30 TaxID=2720226 RepID=UPI001680355D|nr:TRAP transporter large permease subunit [Vibrio sp. S9_S30]MBD1557808.1 TRAP transporter large permease subunit [Vibrio sp. S9_S30]